MTLRPYQVIARDRVFEAWSSGLSRVALVLPTGAGKTVIFSEIIREFMVQRPGAPVLVLAHRDELLQQAAEKIGVWVPGVSVGIVKGALNQVHRSIIVASQQTLAREGRIARLPDFGLVVVDECHRTMGPSYLRVLQELGCADPGGPLTLGVTATFTREDTKKLTDFYEAVPFALDITELILNDPPYLVEPKFRRVLLEGLDLSGVPTSRLTSGRDLAATELAEALERAGAPGVVAEAYRKHAPDRSGMVFTPTVDSAQHVADALNEIGIGATMLSGRSSQRDRRSTLEKFNRGEIQVITNAALLGEGVDAPITSCVVVARPTLSKTLFRQMVGRGLRLHPGKTDCLILDVVGATGRNDLKTLNDVTDVEVTVEEGETLGDAVRRTLPPVPRDSGLEGEAQVSGSLLAIDVDPWAIEQARGRPKNAAGEPLSDEELAELERQRQLELQIAEQEKERRLRRRYKHVPMRSGWHLITNRQRFFIPIETTDGKTGFVVVVGIPGPRHVVGLQLTDIDAFEPRVFEHAADAMQYSVRTVLGIVQLAMERHQIDPDASWRKKPATEGQISKARRYTGENVDFDEWHYRGQVSDFISWGRWHRQVDQFADNLARWANSSATMTALPT
jgi:superfamily II DNA or RNA helicase